MFFWKKKKKEPVESPPSENSLPKEADNTALNEEAQELKVLLRTVSGEARVSALNRLGAISFQRKELDEAIQYYEESLLISQAFGEANTALMRLYNEKRHEAALQKDDAAIQHYLNKLDELMASNKNIMRSSIG